MSDYKPTGLSLEEVAVFAALLLAILLLLWVRFG